MKPFVWEFLLGGDASKKRLKIFTRKNYHGGSPAPPRVRDLVCKFSFASAHFLVACEPDFFLADLERVEICRFPGWSKVEKGGVG